MDFNRKIMTRSEPLARLTERFPSMVTKDAEMSVAEILATINAALAQGIESKFAASAASR